MSDRKVIVVGDAMLDVVHVVTAKGLSAEAPIPVFEQQATRYHLGGAANVAANVKALGGDPTLVFSGQRVAQFDHLLYSHNLSSVKLDGGDVLPVKTRYVDGTGRHVFRVDADPPPGGPDDSLGPTSEARLMTLLSYAPRPPVVCLVNYDKGFFTGTATRQLGVLLDSYRNPVVADPGKTGDWARFSGGHTVFKVNLTQCRRLYEANRFTNLRTQLVRPFDPALDLTVRQPTERYLQAATATFGNMRALHLTFAALVVTCGPGGAVLIGHDGKAWCTGTAGHPVVDVCGAGDTFMAALAYLMAQTDHPTAEDTLVPAVAEANRAAQIAVACRGTAVVSRQDMGWEPLEPRPEVPENGSTPRRPRTAPADAEPERPR